ncbi:hypothetical protein K435DRAFT_797881 [Dendrothele bispora CBS 962.96]|uniref:Uncharacterized protein n=1 Tax=Dendrothele bispora (strain CBS 962.96) TaxID=1314807 RepID=A0A4S8M0Y5_DENBC|nr:hypothetical protein K435DRAFT_797881 [Dendrothele bispora CBS 962.96]
MSATNTTLASINSQALVLRSKYNPLTILEDTFEVNSFISAFLKSVLGPSFSQNPLPADAVRVILDQEGNVRYALTDSYADKLWEKIGVVICILSVAVSCDGTYPAPINIPADFKDIPFVKNLADVNLIDIQHFDENHIHSIQAESLQGLEEILGVINFTLVQYCKWIHFRVKAIIRNGGDPAKEVGQILFMHKQVLSALEAGGALVMGHRRCKTRENAALALFFSYSSTVVSALAEINLRYSEPEPTDGSLHRVSHAWSRLPTRLYAGYSKVIVPLMVLLASSRDFSSKLLIIKVMK